ncbi:uncharacterized protein FA14DRAFT_18724 [Meira miltonrushii]|uniref:Uncharacterized protein n=1 Tax=Meira miltonrushii TaxID=1280837 RepID=A0A316VJA1_9BASI|nr:uncharacterized protein FA14DRAFT_18724 [Meira miltonrushii]PWN37757.1 hypothetical protein FA14DRAFT_18724 [Meira miltonrushii]
MEDAMKQLSGDELLKHLDTAEQMREKFRIQAKKAYRDLVARGGRRVNTWKKQFSGIKIKEKQNELKGDELLLFNEKARKYKASRAARDARRYQRNKDKVLAKAKEQRREKREARQAENDREISSIRRKYNENDVRAANRVALGQVGSVFQPHKQPKTGGGTQDRPNEQV